MGDDNIKKTRPQDDGAGSPRSQKVLLKELMDPRIPKNEIGHAAAKEVSELREIIKKYESTLRDLQIRFRLREV